MPPVVKNLLIINGLFFLGMISIKNTFGVDITEWLGLYFPASDKFLPLQLVTHMFMHGSFGHIFSNMLMLWFLGSAMENYWGSQRFLIYYMITGFGASFMQLGVNALTYMNTLNELGISNFSEVTNTVINSTYNQGLVSASESLYRMKYVPMVGASGAVFGVLLAFGMTFPNQYIYLNFFFPIKAKYFVIGYGLLELYNGIATTGSGIAHFAHLGGMIFGFFLIRKWRSNRWV
jgi:membrane associated rhomboid family serine protease